MSKQGNDFWIQYQKDYAHIDTGAMLEAYADARESETKRQLGLCNLMQSAAADMLCAKDKEIAELKASLEAAKKRVSEAYSDLGALAIKERLKADAEISLRDAELKRLREFVQQCQKSPEKLVKMNWFEDGSFDYCDLVPLQEAAASVLPPAPVTETQNEEQL